MQAKFVEMWVETLPKRHNAPYQFRNETESPSVCRRGPVQRARVSMSLATDKSRDFNILFMVMLITGAGNTALQSILPAIGRSLGVPDSLIATVFSVSALVWVFSAPYWARRSDRQGRRQMVLIGSAGFTISITLMGFVLYAGLHGLMGPIPTMVSLISVRLIYGTFGSAAPPAAQALVALRTAREDRVKALTLLGSAFGLGTILGPALAPYLVVPILGLSGPAFAFALVGGVSWLLVGRYLGDENLPLDQDNDARGANISYPSIGGAPAGASITAATSEQSKDSLAMRDPRIWPWMVAGLVVGHAQAMAGAAMGFLVIDRLGLPVRDLATQQSIGLVLMFGAVAALLVQWGVIPKLKLPPRKMMLVGLVIASIGLCGTASAHSLYSIATSYGLSSVGFGFTRPAFTAGSSLAVGRKLQGLVAGRVTSINGASFVLGPTVGVALYQLNHALPYFVASGIGIALIPYVLRKIPVSADRI
jgi:MFS family permease